MKHSRRFISMLLVGIMLLAISFTSLAEDVYPDVVGTVKEVQKYGNLTMDIEPEALYSVGYEVGDMLKVVVGDHELEIPFGTSYSDVDTGSLVVRDDKEANLLVVAINMGNFSTTYNVEVGDQVTFSLLEKEGYLAEYLLKQLTRTNERSDYETDAIFANFRGVTTTGVGAGVLYRSSSPINNELERAAYADSLAKDAGIKTVINLADSKEEIENYMAAEDFASDYYKSLYDEGHVIFLNMGVDIAGEDFGTKLAEGLRFMAENEGPYLIHCNEGKDRAGFASALLQCLMGASLDEVVADYMTTYENYYNVEKGSEQYNSIAESNIIASLTTAVAGLEKGSDLSNVDLAKAAEGYLERMGMTTEEISALKANLSVAIEETPIKEEPIVEETVEEVIAPKEEVYVVNSGDVLWKIAEKFSTTWEKLAEYNKLPNPHLILTGQKILIPAN